MKLLIVDDQSLATSSLESVVMTLQKKHPGLRVCGKAADGEELLNLLKNNQSVDLVILDLRMPKLDGISALVRIREKYKYLKVVILSAETASRMQTRREGEQIEFSKIIKLLEKIANRVKNNIKIPQKINSILEGCDKLGADPIKVSRYFGADGFILKPISVEKLQILLKKLKEKAPFIYIPNRE